MNHTKIIKERLKFMMIDSNTLADIRRAKKIIEPEIDTLLGQFYEFIFDQPELEKLFVDEETAVMAREGQKKHWLDSLFSGNYNSHYFEQAQKIGRAHARVGLTPKWYIGGYCYMHCRFIELIEENCKDDKESGTQIIKSISKAIYLDMDLVMLSYIDSKNNNIREILGKVADFRIQTETLKEELSVSIASLESVTKTLISEKSIDENSNNELSPLVEQMSNQVQQLGKRLNELESSFQLYIKLDSASAGLFDRLKFLVFGKR